jgi:hypothetical protein
LLLAAGTAAATQLMLPTATPIYRAAPAPPALLSSKPVGEPAPITVYPAITEHPLFYPTRTPYVVLKAPAPAASAAPELNPLHNYTLIGIILSQGVRMALLRPNAGGPTIFAKEGQSVEGWTLHEIRRDRLHFTNAGAAFDLRFTSPRWPH